MPNETERARIDKADEIVSLEARLRLAQQELERLRAREDEILTSASWRITAPLRALATWWRSGRPMRLGGARRSRSPHVHAEGADDTHDEPAATRAADVAKVRALLPGFPDSCVVERATGAQGAGGGYRLLDCGETMASLVGEAAARFLSGAGVEMPDEPLYFGCRANRPSIAFLGGRELLGELAFDAQVLAIRPGTWMQQLVPSRFAFALLECALQGGHDHWPYALADDGRGREGIDAFLRHCRDIGLPLVAWFRGDVDYDRFAWIAAHADRTYATDEMLAARLRRDHPGARIDVLPVAVQPTLHNPIRSLPLLEAARHADKLALFDGWWSLVEGSARRPLIRHLRRSLRIVESEWDFSRQRLGDCPEFSGQVLGCVGPLEKAALDKLFGVEAFLESTLQPAWRGQLMAMRAAASGALPVRPVGDAPEPRTLAGVPIVGTDDALAALVRQWLADPLQRARRAHEVAREILATHCLADRLQRIADDLGLVQRFVDPPARVACLLVTMRPALLQGCLDRFRRDRYPEKELVVVLHDDGADLEAARRLVAPGEPIRILKMGRAHSLGACLNFAFSQTDAPYWAKIDDDDLYGCDYLSDMMLYRRAVDAPLMGKPIAFVYLEGEDALHWMPSWAAQRSLRLWQPGHGQPLIAGGTLLGRRDLLETIRFSEQRRRGSDSDFILRCQAAGHSILAADCFNFALFRSRNPDAHTWRDGEADVRERSGGAVSLEHAGTTVFV